MQRYIASLATVALLFAACPGGPSASAQAPEAPPADAVADTARAGARAEDSREGAEPGPAAEERSDELAPAGDAEGGPEEPGAVSPSGLTVLRAYICKGIEQSEPTEAGKSFIPTPDGVLRLCCFSEIGGAAAADTVYHAWYWGDREMARVALRVQGARWRTWSSKRIIDEWRGDWRVDIVDRDDFVLKRLPFSVE
jgi:hypothetical protein